MRYIDATQLQKQIKFNIGNSILSKDFDEGAMWVLNQIQQFRRAKDVVKVVRCKDCKFFDSKRCVMIAPSSDEKGFCSYGERKKL